MAEILVLKPDPAEPGIAEWIAVDSSGGRLGSPVRGPIAAARIALEDRRLIVLLPSLDVLTTSVDIPLKSQARILQALPFALEESVAEDVEDLHFAAGPRRENGRIPVSVINRDRLDGWLGQLGEVDLKPSAMIAETYGLASIPGTLSLMVSGDVTYLNDGADTELVFQDMGPAEALEAAGFLDDVPDTQDEQATDAEEDARPRHVLLYCDEEVNERYALEIESLRERFLSFDVHLLPDGPLARLAVTVGSGAGVNLLQGAYGPKTEYAGYLRPWRYAAIALVALGVVAVAGKAVSNVQLARQEAELRDAFLSQYQQIAPGTTEVRDPTSVILSLRSRTGVSGGEPSLFLQSLEHLSVAVAQNTESSIQAISYRAGVVDVRLTAPDVSTLDDIQRRIDDQGIFDANIQSTDQDDDKVNSRIQIRTGGR